MVKCCQLLCLTQTHSGLFVLCDNSGEGCLRTVVKGGNGIFYRLKPFITELNFKLFDVLGNGLILFLYYMIPFLICFYALIVTKFCKFKTSGRASL